VDVIEENDQKCNRGGTTPKNAGASLQLFFVTLEKVEGTSAKINCPIFKIT
jgi:hypothetical protein